MKRRMLLASVTLLGALVLGFLALGQPARALPPVIDLNSQSAGLTIYGDDAGDASGAAVAAGDINGDGRDDLIIGAYSADPAGGANAGETYVIYGGGSLPATIDLNSQCVGLTVYGDDADDRSGWAVAAGDINGDGRDDLIIGARYADPAGGADAGETYVIYGEPPPVGGIAELPEIAGERLGTAHSSGRNPLLLAIVAAGTGVLAVGSAAWYARRRWLR